MSSPGRRLRRARERQQKHVAPTAVIYDTTSFRTAEDALLVAARAEGCTCDPDITLADPPHAHVYHDDWCALLRRQDIN